MKPRSQRVKLLSVRNELITSCICEREEKQSKSILKSPPMIQQHEGCSDRQYRTLYNTEPLYTTDPYQVYRDKVDKY